MAISTIGVVLAWGESAEAVEKVIDIKDFPDLYGEAEMLETTHLGNEQQTFIKGVRSAQSMAFTYNYSKEDFAKVEADADKHLYYKLTFSDGSEFTWEGQHSSALGGKGVNEVIEAQVVIAPSTPVVFVTGA